MTLNQLIKKVSELTDSNNHTEARILIAEYFEWKTFEKIFKHIQGIHILEGGMPMELCRYREQKTNEMLKSIEIVDGKEIADKLHSAL